jgi:hypothetical protein|nr:MAG TPA: Head Tail Connector Protein [Caudoviricetes sp.]
MLEKVKLLLGITDTQKDDLLLLVLDMITAPAIEHCKLTEAPEKMESTIVRMAADLYRMEGYGQESAPQTMTSMTEGSRSVSFKSGNSDNIDVILKSYEKALVPFMNRKGRVPSDLKSI